MASITDGIHKAAAEALQRIGDVKWNIACTEIAPPHLTDLEDPLDTIRMRVNRLKEIKEEEWNSLWKPIPMHARETLNAIAETCKDLAKSCWTTKEDGELFLRIRVLTSGWEKRRTFAHRQSLDVWQHSLDLINGIAKSYVQAPRTNLFDSLTRLCISRCRDLESPLPSDQIRRELNTREAYLREFQDRSEARRFYLTHVYNACLLLTSRNLKILDEEDQQDAAGFDELLTREILLLRAAEDLATKCRGTLKELHDALNDAARGKKVCIAAGDCCYCSRIEECVEVFRRGRFSP